MPKIRAKRSAMWMYFSNCIENDNEVVKCNICSATIQHSNNTSNMWSHIRRFHKNILNNSLDEENLVTANATRFDTNSFTSTGTDIQSVEKDSDDMQKYPMDSKRSKEITHFLIKFVAEDVHPFSMVSTKAFINFVKSLNPKYEIPDGKTLVSKYLTEMYLEKCQEIERKLSLAQHVHITIDLWTDVHREMSFLGTIVHFFTNDSVEANTLQVSHLPMQHTVDNLYEVLMQTTRTWQISSKIHSVVTDNGSNIVAAIKKTQWQQLPCFGHAINLVVCNAIKNSENICSIIKKCQNVTHFFETNNAASELLRNQQIRQGLTKILSLKRDVTTQWNSTYLMLNRFIELRTVLLAVFDELNQKDIEHLTIGEWEVIKDTTNILKPFYQATLDLSCENYMTISKVIPIIHCIEGAIKNQGDISTDAQILRTNLLTELNHRFKDIEIHPTYAISTILDPRYKNIAFESKEYVKMAKNNIINEYNIQENKSHTQSSTSNNNSTSTINDDAEADNSIWTDFDKKVQNLESTTDSDDNVASIKYELKRYLKCSVINRKHNPLTWWTTEGAARFPRLWPMAMKYLSIPAISIPSGRLFSKAGQILSDRRTSLQPKHINMLSVISSNEDKYI
ncbi:E3 SUMO-protein ligase ZBED1-like [Calliopsis andreniformis]|uniref:E3 SUMO-protein ligase ZBED1-like n=1 Tax=Calliopsis andreniformis TaxID=337506 RepID=UPI003FCDC287